MKFLAIVFLLSASAWCGEKKYSYKDVLALCQKKCAETQGDDQCVTKCAKPYDPKEMKAFKKRVNGTGSFPVEVRAWARSGDTISLIVEILGTTYNVHCVLLCSALSPGSYTGKWSSDTMVWLYDGDGNNHLWIVDGAAR
jgi:hypothetical protein